MSGPLIVSISATQLLPKERELLKHKAVGGLVLFRENYDIEAQDPKRSLKKLIAEIRSLNPNILIMVDHEGGNIWRFIKENKSIRDYSSLATENEKGIFTKLVAAKVIGVKYDKDKKEALEIAFNNGKIMAEELMECGVDMSLAPVVDLDGKSKVIGELFRAFHADPKVVAEIAEHFIKGMNSAGMPATIKHFPGHGSCEPDSHETLPIDTREWKELQKDLLPFKILTLNSTLNFAIMTAHVIYPAIDPNNTAGYSKKWIQDILRGECRYQGVVLSDCLSMEGAGANKTPLDKLKASLQAGNDFQMFTHQHNTAEKGNRLDKLLAILDHIPDDKASQDRRTALVNSIKRKVVSIDAKTTETISLA